MGMVVRTNTMAINANRQLGVNNSAVAKSLEKLSSGFKINRASDDASGLAISEKMKAQIKGLDQASANSQDGISLIQTAEGATTEIHDMLNRMVELATKSANGTIQDEVDREAIQREVDDLNSEISRIAKSTNFNGINLLDGSLSSTGATSAVSSVKTDLSTETIDAVKGVYTSDALAKVPTNIGDSTSITISLDNGKSYTVGLTVDENLKLIGDDGKEYGKLDAANVKGSLANAYLSAMKESGLGKDFKIITDGNGAFQFTALQAGTSAPKVVGISESVTPKGGKTDLAAIKVTNTTDATDSFQSAAVSGIKTYDPTGNAGVSDINDAVFEVNGKKFVVIKDGTDASAIDKNITVIETANGDAKQDADAAEIANIVSQKTGLNVSYNKNGGIGKNTAVLEFKPGTSTTSNGGLTLQIGDTNADYNKVTVSVDDLSAKGIGTEGLDVSNIESSGDAIDIIKAAINQVSTNRANLGSLQNRLEHTINNLDTASENMTAANSRIRDTDMAKEMMNYTKMNVLVQSAQAMLAQANQQPQSILQLLQ